MHNYQILLVFDRYHDDKAIHLMNRLQKTGIHTLQCTQYTPEAELEQHVKRADFVFVLLTDDAPFPPALCQNTDRLVQEIRDRDKLLYVIKEYRAPLPPDFQGYPLLEPEDGTLLAPQSGGIAGMITNLVVRAENKQVLFEKLSSLMEIDYRQGIQETLAALCELLCTELLDKYPWTREPQSEIKEILTIFEKINCYGTGYGQGQYGIAHKLLDATAKMNPLLSRLAGTEDLFCLACMLRIMELDHVIRASCVDTITSGDIDLYDKPLPELYNRLSQKFLALLNSSIHLSGIADCYSLSQLRMISEQAERCNKLADASRDGAGNAFLSSIIAQQSKETEEEAPLSETEKKLHDIAEFMSKGYTLFETMSNDKTAADFLRCLKTSFERLKNYCDIIEAKAISAQCIGYITRIDQQLGRIEDGEDSQDKVGLGLKALLGLKLPNSGQYDVFLSYKHEDEDIVRKVYHYLKSKLLNPFFDKISLPELSESDYHEAIMNALDHSRHFLVIITNLAQLNAYWIKLEMKTFNHEMVEGRKEDANFIMLVTDQVYSQIMASNKTLLDLRYRSCEIMRIRDYKDVLDSYLNK